MRRCAVSDDESDEEEEEMCKDMEEPEDLMMEEAAPMKMNLMMAMEEPDAMMAMEEPIQMMSMQRQMSGEFAVEESKAAPVKSQAASNTVA